MINTPATAPTKPSNPNAGSPNSVGPPPTVITIDEPMISAATRQKAGAKRGAAKTNSKKVVETKTKRELYQLLVEGEMHRRRTTYARACTLVAVAQDVTPKTVRNNTTDPTIKPA